MGWGFRWGIGIGVCGSACAVAHPVALRSGDVSGKPSIEVLPSLDVSDDGLTSEMRAAETLSADSLNFADPSPPPSRVGAQLEIWSQKTLGPWLEQKHRRAEDARRELDLAAGQNPRQRVLAGALVGLVYEDVARVILSVPAPLELDTEPEVLSMYQQLLVKQAKPYLLHAQLAYQACAANAQAIEALRHWSQFCDARAGRLPRQEQDSEPRDQDQRGQGETTVTVSRE